MECKRDQYGAEHWTYSNEEFPAMCRHQMDKERQKQDYDLAMRARLVVGWVVGVVVSLSIASATILGGLWIGLRR